MRVGLESRRSVGRIEVADELTTKNDEPLPVKGLRENNFYKYVYRGESV